MDVQPITVYKGGEIKKSNSLAVLIMCIKAVVRIFI